MALILIALAALLLGGPGFADGAPRTGLAGCGRLPEEETS